MHWTPLLEYRSHDTNYMLWIISVFWVFLSLYGFYLHHSILELLCLNCVSPGCWRRPFNVLYKYFQLYIQKNLCNLSKLCWKPNAFLISDIIWGMTKQLLNTWLSNTTRFCTYPQYNFDCKSIDRINFHRGSQCSPGQSY